MKYLVDLESFWEILLCVVSVCVGRKQKLIKLILNVFLDSLAFAIVVFLQYK